MSRRPRRRNASSAVAAGTVGIQLLSSILGHGSAQALRDVSVDLFSDGNETRQEMNDEERAFTFIRDHFDRHQSLPSAAIVLDNTGVRIPPPDRSQPTSYYLERARHRAMFRHIMDPYNRLQEALQNPRTSMGAVREAVTDMYSVNNRYMEAGTGTELFDTIGERVLADHNERRMAGGLVRGITTGWYPVDQVMDGYNRGDLVVWVGRPGRGKSWLLLNQCYHAWTAGYHPLYISMEMGAEQNVRRILGIHSRVNPTLIKRGQIGTLAMPRFMQSYEELRARRPFPVITSNFSRTVDQIANFVDIHDPDIVFIDAGYLLSPKKKRFGSGGRRETISDVIEELKELASNANRPFVITVQFNRTAEQRRRGSNARRREGEAQTVDPLAHLSLAEIGETDVIGQAASHVLGIEYPPYPLPNNAYRVFGFLKGREGESGWWLSNYMQTQTSPVDMSLVPMNDPVYDIIRRGGGQNARRANPGQRSAMMRLQD